MAVAKILEHGQITIPKPIRESLGLKILILTIPIKFHSSFQQPYR